MKDFSIGIKIYFTEDLLPYTIVALSGKYAIASRKLHRRFDAGMLHDQVKMGAYCTFTEAYNHQKDSVVYTIIDFANNKRGPDNLVFGIYDYKKTSDCKKAIKALEKGEIELSRRKSIVLDIDHKRTFNEIRLATLADSK